MTSATPLKAQSQMDPADLKEVLEILKDIQATLKDFVKGKELKRVSLNSQA